MKAWLPLFRRAGIFLTGNVAAQGLSAVTGLLLARWLSVPDYAVYTVFITIMGAISVVTKGGVHLGFTGILGRHWPDRQRASEAVTAMHQVRRKISVFMLPPIALLSGVLVYRAQESLVLTVAVLVALLVFWAADMRSRIVDQVLFFNHQTGRVQWLDTSLAALRLVAIGCLFFVGTLDIYAAVAIAALVAVFRVPPIQKWVAEVLPARHVAAIAPDVREMTDGAKRQAPVEVFYVMQGQLVLLTLALWGSAADTAGYGALTRIAQLLLPVQAFTYAFCVPYFSRSTDHLVQKFFRMVALLALPGLSLMVVVAAAPHWVLQLIGPQYTGLETELLWATFATTITSIAGNAWSLVAHRGWLKWSWIQIPVGIAWSLIALLTLPLGSVTTALVLQAGFASGLMAATALEFLSHARKQHGTHESQQTVS